MVNGTLMKKKIIKSRGFSLLEVIFVLAFLGIILLAAGNYARKLIDEKTRQTAADAVAQDVYGTLQFINAGSITATVNNVTKKIINPLYQQPADPISEDPADINTLGIQKNPLWLAHPGSSAEASSQSVSPYIARSWSKSVNTPVSNGLQVTDPDTGTTYYSHSLKWSRAVWGPDSVRGYFTDSACAGASGHVYFNQQFLSCDENPVLRGSEIAISRIDLVSDKGTVSRPAGATTAVPVGIDRVDVYISFSPVDNNPARIEQFITPLMTAFRLKKITPNANAIYLVRQQTPAASNAWTLLDKTTGQPATPTTPDVNLAHFSDLPDMIDKLQHGQTYAIRFSFDGKGDYLRTDGLNSADKVCWNTTTGAAGPCLTSPAQDALVLKQRQNIREFANLQVGDVISKGSHLRADGTPEDEYYTAPQIQYAAFNNTGTNIGPYYKGGTDDQQMCTAAGNCGNGPAVDLIADTANGAISVPLQTCPTGVDRDGGPVTLHPRLSAAVSSVVSGITKDGPKNENLSAVQMVPDIFKNPAGTMTTLSGSDVTLNRLGGTVLQVRLDTASGTWRIAGMVASEDASDPVKGRSWIYFNPSWLSVMITTWCSSVEQPRP
ncbi:type II secretion system protein [Salmonella enterica subsp. enterica serovar Java]|uniref:Type II secretion system protein n=5 Tax=Salmonella enterica TaxID=28901 RepID=A0A5U8K6Z1_SALEB|nr:type II secretion system protein [Salmonella enterica subsp. enterica serovar Java]EAN9728420.1 type II secretion system protein [Salmonella enterica]EBV8394044.1 type II secretion system protein [Salmonella enterica subsp. enterica serovar Virchow]EAB6034073.1 type II secretion system protein [Salmonella enterica subsp. enterica serovar Java]EAB8478957.1 type II secretion system protein [Salmonella enterica subsp. enterica serovar Java]